MSEPIYIQITWEDPMTGESEQTVLAAPITIGRDLDQMPGSLGEQTVSRLALDHKQVSRFHALITMANQQMYVTDKSSNGTFLNGQPIRRQSTQPLSSKDTLRIGPYKVTAVLAAEDEVEATEIHQDLSVLSTSKSNSVQKNTFMMWAIAATVLLVMTAGAGLMISQVLQFYRPQVPEQIGDRG